MELTVDQELQQAFAAHKEGKLEDAERLYRTILQSQPLHPDANHNLGVLAVSLNKDEAALPLFKTALEANPKIEQFWLSYIDALIKEKQFENAKEVLAQGKKEGLSGDKIDAIETQITTATQVTKPKLVVQKKSLTLSEKGKKLAEQKKQKKAKKQKSKAISPSEAEINNLLHQYQTGRYGDAEKLALSLTERFPHHNFSWKVLAEIFKKIGRTPEALVSGQKAVEIDPQDPEAHFNLGITLQELGRLEEAEESYTQAIALKAKFAEAHYNLGNTLQELGRLDEAEASFTQAIALKPDFELAHYNLGNTLKELERYNEAEASYIQAIALKPDYVEAHINLGITLAELGKLNEAEASYKQAIALKPAYAEAHNNLGNTLQILGRLEEAEASYTQAITLKPDYAEAHSNLGVALQELGRLEDAEASHTQAIALKPDYAEAHSSLGNTLKELGRLDDAEASHAQAIALKPDYADAHSNLGNTLQQLGRLDEAEASFTQAIALKPDYAEAHYNLGNTLLNSGRLKEGLDEYEWRWKMVKNMSKNRHFPQPLWDGQKSLQGKRILLWSEQGIGDTINWSSCLPLVASLAGHTILECQEKIIPLLARSFPNIEIKPENRSIDSQRNDFDFHIPMGSLYRHFISKIGQNSNIDAYLIPDPVRVKFWRDRLNCLGKGPYVGICWKSSVVSPERLKLYPSISEWSSIITIPDLTFINLQYSDFADDLAKIKDKFEVTVHNFDDLDQYDNVDDVAALCAALDMVVSTKVTPVILSSGVGTPTKVANWRQSIWNNVLTNPVSSSVDMFERDTWEPWEPVFQLIAEDIFKLKDKTTPNTKDISRN